jgi:oligosaccharyltransferase complex subunit beta
MRSPLPFLASIVAFFGSAIARSATGDRVLVILEPSVARDEYSKFWGSLKGQLKTAFEAPRAVRLVRR